MASCLKGFFRGGAGGGGGYGEGRYGDDGMRGTGRSQGGSQLASRAQGSGAVLFSDAKRTLETERLPGYPAPIPVVLISLRKHLAAINGFEAEGLFRIPAEKAETDMYMEQLKRGEYALEGCSAYATGELIMRYYRDMPKPLLSTLDEEFVTTVDNKPSKLFDRMSKKLSRGQLALFLWLLDTMIEAAAVSHLNKMNYNALSAIATPSLFKISYDRLSGIADKMESRKHVLVVCFQQRDMQKKARRSISTNLTV